MTKWHSLYCPKSCLFQKQTVCSTKIKYSLWLVDLLTSFLMSKMSVSELLKNTKPWKTLSKTLLKGDSQNLRLINGPFLTFFRQQFEVLNRSIILLTSSNNQISEFRIPIIYNEILFILFFAWSKIGPTVSSAIYNPL